jgi:sirohydrochlorin ferrochelatase
MHALILFSHGSLLCGAVEALEAHAARLRERGAFDAVEIGYLNYSEPAFADTVRDLAERGVRHITIAPYFLISGYFVTKSLPEALAPVQATYPELTFRVADALGYDETLADALLESALNARPAEYWRGPLARAANACRPFPDCPLYGTPSCPKVPHRADPPETEQTERLETEPAHV